MRKVPNRMSVIGAVLVAALALAGAAWPSRSQAEDGDDPCQPDAHGPAGARMFHKLDPEGTGKVVLASFVAHRVHRFEHLDANADGRVTRLEFDGRRGRGSPAERAAAFARLDTNGDSVVPRAEWDADETQRFHGIDADHDGIMTRDEFLADRKRVCAERAQAPAPDSP